VELLQVWMGSMDGVNAWEDFFGSVCKPQRQVAVDRITRSFVNELVVTFLKRSRSAEVHISPLQIFVCQPLVGVGGLSSPLGTLFEAWGGGGGGVYGSWGGFLDEEFDSLQSIEWFNSQACH